MKRMHNECQVLKANVYEQSIECQNVDYCSGDGHFNSSLSYYIVCFSHLWLFEHRFQLIVRLGRVVVPIR